MSTSARARPTSPAATPDERVLQMQRRRVLLALAEVLSEQGLQAATVGRVCERAKVSRRTFYELFPNIEACLVAAFEEATAQLAATVGPVFATADPWHARLRAALEALLVGLDRQPRLAWMLLVESARAGSELSARRRQIVQRLVEAVDQGRAEARARSAPPPLTAQGVVGGALSVIEARLLESRGDANASPSLPELVNELMAMAVHPYLGAAAARRELARPPTPAPAELEPRGECDPLRGLPIRFTYRTAQVLATIASEPGSSNRQVGETAGISDAGQTSRLLHRLSECGLVENRGRGHPRGERNAWTLTARGKAVHATLALRPAAR